MKCKQPNYRYFTKDEAIAAIGRDFGGNVVELLLDTLETDARRTWYAHKRDVKFRLDDGWEAGYMLRDDEVASCLLYGRRDDPFARGILTNKGIMVFSSQCSLHDFLENDNVAAAVKNPTNYVRKPLYGKSLKRLTEAEEEESALDEAELERLAEEAIAECA